MYWTAKAPAKINITLDILSRRPDGYHDVDMIMQAVSLYDDEKKPRGEYVLIIEGASEKDLKEDFSIEDAVEIAKKSIADGMKPTDACKLAAKKTGFSKGEIYSLISSDKT